MATMLEEFRKLKEAAEEQIRERVQEVCQNFYDITGIWPQIAVDFDGADVRSFAGPPKIIAHYNVRIGAQVD